MHRSPRPIGLVATPTIFSILLSLLAIAILPATALAEEDEEFGRPGGYARIGAMGGVDIDRRADNTVTNGGGGFNLWLGTRESERLAWEVGLEGVIFDGSANSAWTYGVNGKFYFTQSRIQPYLVLGVNGTTRLSQGEKRKTDWAFRPGIGVDFYLTETWALNAEGSYVASVGDLLRREYVSFGLGLLYRF